MLSILSVDFTSNALGSNLIYASRAEAAVSTKQHYDKSDVSDAVDAYPDSLLAVRRGVLVPQAPINPGTVSEIAESKIMRLQSEKVEIQIEIDRLRKLMSSKDEEINALQTLPATDDNLFEEQYNPCESPEQGYSEIDMLVPTEASIRTVADNFNEIDFNEALKMADGLCSQSPLPETDEDIDIGDAPEIDENEHRKRKRISPAIISEKQRDGTQPEQGATFADEKNSKITGTTDIQTPYSKLRKRSSTIIQLKKRFSGAHCDQDQPQNSEKSVTVDDSNLNEIGDPSLQHFPHYEHRPKTWPFRQAFRQSVDISVRTLFKGFERLRV